ncbi:hypothetical protein PC117_g5876 [Phytophthora cactorum]|uniref:AB hydrolase-1 domain-containing protein n=1 Tax=Phytophthora cactorum TaxID=29920 RepID=A0A8T1E8Q9_9STRA|nr:hypothetical protein PC117_g5876 [Phytophthora cactorum]
MSKRLLRMLTMQLHRMLAMVMIGVLGHISAAPLNGAVNHPLNGWYPCREFTFLNGVSSSGQGEDAECAIYTAPFCYPGICEVSEFAEPTADIFAKRIPATAGDTKTAHNVWLLQGGPGYSFTAIWSDMVELRTKLGGAVNVYTMDYRGTGRSTLFDCVAAQITTTGSTWGRAIDPSEVPTSAKDLRMNSIVYGVSYGTVVVERLMHLNPPTVNGYFLDGIATTSEASVNNFKYYSEWDVDCGEVGEHFMELFAQDSSCSSHFQSTNLSVTLHDMMMKMDNDPNSTCAKVLSNSTDTPPSFVLRTTFSVLLKDAAMRTFIPAVVYRLNRCNSNDVDVLNRFFTWMNAYSSFSSQDDSFQSTLLYYLIIFSDMWETPSPSTFEMESHFTNAAKSPACDELNLSNYEGEGIIHQRDQYWNKSAVVSTQASVLLLSGKLDPQTPHKYAEYLLDALDCPKKEIVTFDYATHGTIVSTTFVTYKRSWRS